MEGTSRTVTSPNGTPYKFEKLGNLALERIDNHDQEFIYKLIDGVKKERARNSKRKEGPAPPASQEKLKEAAPPVKQRKLEEAAHKRDPEAGAALKSRGTRTPKSKELTEYEKRRLRSKEITEVKMINSKTWKVTGNDDIYEVTKNKDYCHEWICKGFEPCSHSHECNCPDTFRPCKHIFSVFERFEHLRGPRPSKAVVLEEKVQEIIQCMDGVTELLPSMSEYELHAVLIQARKFKTIATTAKNTPECQRIRTGLY